MTLTCEVCKRQFKTQATLESHKRWAHGGASKEMTLLDFIKAGIAAGEPQNELILHALERYPTETYANVLNILTQLLTPPHPAAPTPTPTPTPISQTPQTSPPNPPAKQLEPEKTSPEQPRDTQPHVLSKQSKHAFTRFKDFNIELIFNNKMERYYTDLPPEIVEEMRLACLDAIVATVKKHPEITLDLML